MPVYPGHLKTVIWTHLSHEECLRLELAHENGIELQVIRAAREMFKRAYDAGWGKDDGTRVIEVYEGQGPL